LNLGYDKLVFDPFLAVTVSEIATRSVLMLVISPMGIEFTFQNLLDESFLDLTEGRV
jgi:hypothetical protein